MASTSAAAIRRRRPRLVDQKLLENVVLTAITNVLKPGVLTAGTNVNNTAFAGRRAQGSGQLRSRPNDPIVASDIPDRLPNNTREQVGDAMPTSRTIPLNGIEMFLLEQGEGPLVVLCHGWPELSYSWRHQVPALAAAGYHVVAPDMRGFGRTSAPADIGAYSIFDTVGDMVALVAALGAKQAAIIGHGWGAPVAWHAALFR